MTIRARIIPSLQICQGQLVKTEKFKKYNYVGDPINTLRVFNEKQVDEIVISDIYLSKNNQPPNLNLIKSIASECFMPLSYGGGIYSIDNAKAIFKLGVEKIIIKSLFYKNINLLRKMIAYFGSQSICLNIDYRRHKISRKYISVDNNNKSITDHDPIKDITIANNIGIGEVILNSTNKDGTLLGLDSEILLKIPKSISMPIALKGGCNGINDMKLALQKGASAVMVGSYFIYHGKFKAVLLQYPNPDEIDKLNFSRPN